MRDERLGLGSKERKKKREFIYMVEIVKGGDIDGGVD